MLLPLLSREFEEPIAWLTRPLKGSGLAPGPVKVSSFLSHVYSMAERLPQADFSLNLCGNRYLFLVSFCASILNRQTNLLPPNKNATTQRKLCERYGDVVVIHDGIEVISGPQTLDVSDICLSADDHLSRDVPHIDPEFLAAIAFTSGSTGESKDNAKYWKTFWVSSQINGDHMLVADETVNYVLATVPGQHMWGMETSILLPLFRRLCISDARPMFPQDIVDGLSVLPLPRLLVLTPVHLRAMTLSGIAFPDVDLTLCATAPLSSRLASDAEQLCGGELREVYGCSEVGSMAWRRTSENDSWNIFKGLMFAVGDTGKIKVYAEHLPAPVLLSDRLEILGDSQFRLLGRSEDMVEIGGKRGSLAEMNKILLDTKGVLDGVVFSGDHRGMVNRLVAIVVAPSLTSVDIIRRFRSLLDDVFVPRPIIMVEALPREDNGKLSHKRLLDFYKTIKSCSG